MQQRGGAEIGQRGRGGACAAEGWGRDRSGSERKGRNMCSRGAAERQGREIGRRGRGRADVCGVCEVVRSEERDI